MPTLTRDFENGTRAIYQKYYGLLEKRRWSIDEDIDWNAIERHTADAPLQNLLYIASLIESFTFTTTPNFLRKHRDKPWIIALQMARGYEECKHGNALWRYLEGLGYPVDSRRISAIQETPDPSEDLDLFSRNVYAWLSEVETTVFYHKASQTLTDPVGKQLLALITQDERVHGAFLFDTFKLQLQLEPQLLERYQQILQAYQDPSQESHYGAAVGEALFAQVRDWAGAHGVAEEVGAFVQQRTGILLQALD
ncbi:MAG: hypothetical protein ACO1RX_03780 [Candidatus Sericytochromatia bacterium]